MRILCVLPRSIQYVQTLHRSPATHLTVSQKSHDCGGFPKFTVPEGFYVTWGYATSNTAMKERICKAGWGILHQVTLTAALVLFPVALVTEQLGLPIPLGSALRRAVNRTTTAYDNVS